MKNPFATPEHAVHAPMDEHPKLRILILLTRLQVLGRRLISRLPLVQLLCRDRLQEHRRFKKKTAQPGRQLLEHELHSAQQSTPVTDGSSQRKLSAGVRFAAFRCVLLEN